MGQRPMKTRIQIGILSALTALSSASGVWAQDAKAPDAKAPDATKIQDIPDFMKIVVTNEGKEPEKSQIAFDNVYALNDEMFDIYEKSLLIYKKHFLERQNLIMALFSAKGGRFILYQAGKPPLEAEPPPPVYQLAKSCGHCAMATYDLLAPYSSDSAANQGWVGELASYRVRVQTALDSINALDIEDKDKALLRRVLEQIATFQDSCLKDKQFTYEELHAFARGVEPDLAKLIALASSTQVGHWYKVIERWKGMLGKDWDNTYALSNSIYVARQNNILFSTMLQFMGLKAVNDRLLLLETTDFTATPDDMFGAFIRIISDRALGKVFFNNYRLMDAELLGGGGRAAIEAEAAKRGQKPILPPLAPFNSTQIPWKTDPGSGTGPARLEEVH